jgi:iron complex transport system ATP-binding protein
MGSERSMSTLEARQISVHRGGRNILQLASVSLASGELRAVVGPNGGGKSTLLRALAGIWPIASGDVWLDGKPITQIPRKEVARRIAYVPQEQRLDFAFTVEQIVAMGRYPHRGRFSRETENDRRAIELSLERCDIVHLRSRPVNTLSGGEHQRVLIARSLAVEPQFILLDEPTANLDVEHSLEILELCRQLARSGQSIVLATHDLNAVARYATSVVLMQAGQLTDCGSDQQVLDPRSLEKVFGIRAELLSTTDGHPVYVFHRRSQTEPDN